MASFLVLAPRPENGERDEDKTVFIRDGFVFLAFVLPFVWLLFHRLWFEAILVLAAGVAISAVGSFTGQDGAAALIGILVSILVGLEANSWRAAALERRGFRLAGVVDAHNAADAETIWFLGTERFRPVASRVSPNRPPDAAPSVAAPRPVLGGMVGLVSHRGEN
ncbi:MAG: DUF2628 domain-containing protein [Phyllobacterium sp.]|uniref:DUF2628 domain-containing protein n=1 Tax=Phyllobacterium sp. TaxID=1871046 RepID=UPI0030EFF2DF